MKNASLPKRTISVMTYNILAQKYAQGGWHNYCAPEYLRWESRRQRIFEEIETFSSDIICLQEVEASVFSNELQPWLAARGYAGHYLARQYGENVQGPPEGVALFYRSDSFELLRHQALTFSAARTAPPAPPAPSLSSTDGEEFSAAAAAAAAGASSLDQSVDSDGEGTGSGLADAGAGVGAERATSRRGDLSEPERAAPSSSATATAARPAKRQRGDRNGGGGAQASTSGRDGGGGGGGGGGRGNNEFWSVFTRRQEGAILALLRHRPSRRRLLAAVTHLFWNPAFPDVKAFQAAVLCQEMAAFLHRHAGSAPGGVPVVLAGDFNSLSRKCVPDHFDPKIPGGPDGLVSGVVSLLTRGSLPPDHPDHPASRRRPGETGNPDFRGLTLTSAGLELASAYQQACGRDPPLTTRTATFAGCLDYIFVSPQHFEVTRTLELPYEDAVPPYRAVRDPLSDVPFDPIPNDVYPSDHLSLAAVLRFRD